MQSGPIEKKPILVKLPVDKEVAEIVALVEVCIAYGVAWVIISNLTKKREYIFEQQEISGTLWGISGKPTQAKSDFLIGEVYKQFGKQIVIIGVGGIFCAEDAYHKIRQGATLVQLITGMIFQWPQLIGEMNAWLVDLLRKDGFAHVQQAIWANHHQEYM
jgi:dihydroorotate dehydrogenase